MDPNFLKNVQDAFSKESEDAAKKNRPPATTVPPPAQRTNESMDGMTLSKYFEEKHNIKLTDEQILERIKGNEALPPGSSGSAAPDKMPALEDIQDEDVGVFLDTNYDKKREPLTRYSERAKKEDLDLVKESYIPQLKAQFKDLDVAQIETLFNERFFISEDDTYSPQEKAYGLSLLKDAASKLRDEDKNVIEEVRHHLHGQRIADYNNKLHAQTVDAFMKDAPAKITLQLGKSGTKELGEYEFDVPAPIREEITAILKDPSKLADEFKDEKDGKKTLNLGKLYQLLLKVKLDDNIFKSLASHYHSQGVEEVEKTLFHEPDLSGKQRRISKSKEEQEQTQQAITHNKTTLEQNIGRGNRNRQKRA